MKNLSVTLIQTNLAWENPTESILALDKLTTPIKNTDVIILPEMFTTGFTMKPEQLAEPHGGQGLQWLQQKAKEKNCVITGSICVEENKKYYNRLYWVEPDKMQQYNKRHLFRMGEEDKHYTAGKEKIIVEKNGWKILPLICYDLRFPVWSRNKWKQQSNELVADYDVLVYVANWPEVRSYPFKQLLIARAIENQCYVVGVNRIGTDGNDFTHSGDSVVINPLGEIISKTKPHQESVETVELNFEFLTNLRKKFPVGLDAENFEIA